MAVQAQYPSNLLFLNRNVQEEKPQIRGDYAYNQQHPAGEGFIDQSNMLFSSGVEANNPRKRTREIAANSSSQNRPFSIQPHPSQFINLRLAFDEQQQQQQQSLCSQSPVLYSVLSDDLTAQFRQQKDEIEQFLHAQGEHLRCSLAEKRQRHHLALLGAAKESVSRRLKEKEAEVVRAARLNAELEAQAARLGFEVHAWQTRARAGEAAVTTLQAQLQQAIMGSASAHDPTEMGGDAVVEEAESGYVDPDRVVAVANNNSGGCSRPTCKSCWRGVASVVLLPCRHLSVCTECDRSVTNRTCPVCFSFKESSVEVYFS